MHVCVAERMRSILCEITVKNVQYVLHEVHSARDLNILLINQIKDRSKYYDSYVFLLLRSNNFDKNTLGYLIFFKQFSIPLVCKETYLQTYLVPQVKL